MRCGERVYLLHGSVYVRKAIVGKSGDYKRKRKMRVFLLVYIVFSCVCVISVKEESGGVFQSTLKASEGYVDVVAVRQREIYFVFVKNEVKRKPRWIKDSLFETRSTKTKTECLAIFILFYFIFCEVISISFSLKAGFIISPIVKSVKIKNKKIY